MRTFSRASVFVLVSLTILIPSYWQPRIQAGDLSSHVYNAWLAREAAAGKVQGVYVVVQYTNVLFDLLLSGLVRAAGWGTAQKLAVSCCVLLFFWGGFAWISTVAGRRAWGLAPLIAMLAYGWVFHVGFFNFYLSLGLSMCALALVWRRYSVAHLAGGAALLLIASTAHILPVVWAGGAAVYSALTQRASARVRIGFAAAGMVAILAIRTLITARLAYAWDLNQAFSVTGADQILVYGVKYLVISALLLLSLAFLCLRQIESKGIVGVLLDPAFHIYFLTAAAVLLIPKAIEVPGYVHSLVYISQRMSLPAALAFCAAVASAGVPKGFHVGMAVIAGLFFSFLFVDDRALGALETEMERAVTQLPPRQRVVSGVCETTARVDPVSHMTDRACIGRCYSYANYEPSTTQFRVRAMADNGIVMADYDDSYDLSSGKYAVKEQDLPLYQLYFCEEGRVSVCVRPLKAGETAVRDCRPILPEWWRPTAKISATP